jgi:hypothetical protein
MVGSATSYWWIARCSAEASSMHDRLRSVKEINAHEPVGGVARPVNAR